MTYSENSILDPQVRGRLRDALRRFKPDQRKEEIESALREIEAEERDKSLNEEFAGLSTENKLALLSYAKIGQQGEN